MMPHRGRHQLLGAAAIIAVWAAILSPLWVSAADPTPATRGASSEGIEVPMNRSGLREVILEQQADGTFSYHVVDDDGVRRIYAPDAFAEMLYSQQSTRPWWQKLLNISSPIGFVWVGVGLLGQLLFTGRMIVQWLVSERSRKSVVPPAFWWMSLIGASMLLTYFIWRRDLVGVLGQATGWFIYVRNIYFIYTHQALTETATPDETPLAEDLPDAKPDTAQ